MQNLEKVHPSCIKLHKIKVHIQTEITTHHHSTTKSEPCYALSTAQQFQTTSQWCTRGSCAEPHFVFHLNKYPNPKDAAHSSKSMKTQPFMLPTSIHTQLAPSKHVHTILMQHMDTKHHAHKENKNQMATRQHTIMVTRKYNSLISFPVFLPQLTLRMTSQMLLLSQNKLPLSTLTPRPFFTLLVLFKSPFGVFHKNFCVSWLGMTTGRGDDNSLITIPYPSSQKKFILIPIPIPTGYQTLIPSPSCNGYYLVPKPVLVFLLFQYKF